MKKYEKIMSVFVKAIKELEKLERGNATKAVGLETKKDNILAEAHIKAQQYATVANELIIEGTAALNTVKKLKDLLS